MRVRDTLILLIILIVLVGLYWFTSREQEASSTDETITLYRVDSEQVRSLNFTFEGKELKLERDAASNKWVIDPEKTEADQNRIGGLALAMSAVVADQVVAEDAGDLAQFGLDRPRMVATVRLEDGTSKTLHIGNENPVASKDYATLPGSNTVYLINPSWSQSIRNVFETLPLPPTPTPQASPTAAPAR